ncbi:hypothetical protein DENIS_1658 [Desulfonema ishimotonii]|uniref:SGNH/GDSL hydrolase family protein n=1 Tax=Desulfonema ishimotonii TaxID=45657 RepID=A0A401FUQ7_9BACT|nr:hypothetical protein [Desulfonema ishimotonii]GBC60701.1 hypothetical protein DENIS_1658 [Desulfonema ishimotonii]
MEKSQRQICWKEMVKASGAARRFLIFCAGLVILELVLSQVLPHLLSETRYLAAYLPWQSLHQTRRFLNNELDVVPDPACGWRNKRNATWLGIHYDAFGSRSYGGISQDMPRKRRVIFLGDSRVNGYTYVNNSQTINACLEDDSVETLNMATPFYGPDQMYIAMGETLRNFTSDVVVIGLGSGSEQLLDCHYIPFLGRQEYGVPFLKPCYTLRDGQLVLQAPDIQALLRPVPDAPALLRYLSTHDNHYERFKAFQSWECTPFLAAFSCARAAGMRMGKKFAGWQRTETLKNGELMRALVRAIEALGKAHNAEVVFLLFPSLAEFQEDTHPVYDRTAMLLRQETATFLDIRVIFKKYRGNEPLFADDRHITCTANRLIAGTLKHIVSDADREGPVIGR